MLLEKYNSIMKKSEAHRSRWALGISTTLSIVVFLSFAFYKGFLSFGDTYVTPQNQMANVVSSESVPTPIENTKGTFMAAFSEIGKQYNKFADSLSSVFVPFITGIEVYNRK